jgi:serine/threonine protein kinase
MQIMSGLRYLNRPYVAEKEEDNVSNNKSSNSSKRLSIIHYDLKPANILFDEMGDVKITGNNYLSLY